MTTTGLAAARAIVAAVVRQTPAYEIADPVALSALDDPTLDPSFESLGIDSLGRMEFCILLAEQFGIELAADDLVTHATVGILASHLSSVLSLRVSEAGSSGDSVAATGSDLGPKRAVGHERPGSEQEPNVPELMLLLREASTDSEGYRLLRRIEGIATPEEAFALTEDLDARTATLVSVKDALVQLGKQLRVGSERPRGFAREQVAEAVQFYRCTDGDGTARSVIVMFTGNADRLFLPTPVILQHVPTDHDVVLIVDPAKRHYLHGLPGIATDLRGVCDWLKVELLHRYDDVVCLGSSSGGNAAIVAGEILGARRAVCSGGRSVDGLALPERRTANAAQRGRDDAGPSAASGTELWAIFSADNSRDRAGAIAIREHRPAMALLKVERSKSHNTFIGMLKGGELAGFLELLVRGALPRDVDADGVAVVTRPPALLALERRNVRRVGTAGPSRLAWSPTLLVGSVLRALRALRRGWPA